MKKKILLSLVVVLAISAMVVALVACDPDNKNDDTAKVGSNAYTIGYSAASMNAQQGATASASAQNGNSFGFSHSGEITAESSEFLQEIAAQVKSIEEFIDRSSVQIKEEISDRTDFTHKMVITANSALTGENDTYTLYYNTKLVASETEVDDDDLDIETEEEYTISGVVVNGENEFEINGGMEIESEGDENEQEFYMTAYLGELRLELKQEFSTEGNEIEEELCYTFYGPNNTKLYSFSVEFETDEDGEELVVKSDLIDGISPDLLGAEIRYKRTVDEQGRKCVNVKISAGVGIAKVQAMVKVYYDINDNGETVLGYEIAGDADWNALRLITHNPLYSGRSFTLSLSSPARTAPLPGVPFPYVGQNRMRVNAPICCRLLHGALLTNERRGDCSPRFSAPLSAFSIIRTRTVRGGSAPP